jgi:hypothetical protein
MELILLNDVVASYGSLWLRVANSRDLPQVKIHDRFREQGFGEGAEELEVEGIDLSPVSGASRIFVRRAANNTKAEVHRLGAVMMQVNQDSVEVIREIREQRTEQLLSNGSASAEELVTVEGSTEPLLSPKRGRGRPKGAKNKPKPPLTRVPAWPGIQ